MSTLMTVSETLNQIVDILANYWDKALLICGGTAGATTIFVLFGRWIWGLISSKIGKKNIALFVSKVSEFEQKVTDLPKLVNSAIQEQLNTYEINLTTKLNNALQQYNQTKQTIYTKVITDNEKADQILKELQETTLELKTEIQPIIEEVVETVEPIIEEVSQTVSRETNDEEEIII